MYIKAGEEKPFKATLALDFEEWNKTVTKFPLKCKCSNTWQRQFMFYYSQLNLVIVLIILSLSFVKTLGNIKFN